MQNVVYLFTGAHEPNYALYDLHTDRTNNEKTLVSPRIPAGSYCLGFWFYKTASNSILSISLKTTSKVSALWAATHGPAKQWTLQTVAVQSNDQFQVNTSYFDCNYDLSCRSYTQYG